MCLSVYVRVFDVESAAISPKNHFMEIHYHYQKGIYILHVPCKLSIYDENNDTYI